MKVVLILVFLSLPLEVFAGAFEGTEVTPTEATEAAGNGNTIKPLEKCCDRSRLGGSAHDISEQDSQIILRQVLNGSEGTSVPASDSGQR